MKTQIVAGLVLAGSLLAAVQAMAGPISSGLAHTEEVARRAAAARGATIRVAAANDACAFRAATRLEAHEDVEGVTARGSELEVRLRNSAVRDGADGAVAAAVAQACETTAPVVVR